MKRNVLQKKCERFGKKFKLLGVSCHCRHIYSWLKRKNKTGVFIHPFFNRGINNSLQYAFEKSFQGKSVFVLVPVRTDTLWWHEYLLKASEIWFFKGRAALTHVPATLALFVFDSKIKRRTPLIKTVELPVEVKT